MISETCEVSLAVNQPATGWRAARCLAALLLTGAQLAILGGCADGQNPGESPALVQRAPLPTYADAATRYNTQVAELSRVFVGGAVVRVTFVDEQGVQRREQVEGTLQMIRPAKLALNIRKVGQALFWLGSDESRYWWFDLTGETKYAVYGRHELFTPAQAKRIGLAIHPLELVRLLGVMPLPLEAGAVGATQWSSDGRLLGISTTLAAGGYERVWVEPETSLTRKIELFDSGQQLLLTAEHSGHETVTMADIPVGPLWATRIVIRHAQSGAELDLSLADATDGRKRISEKAFVFEQVSASLKPDKTIDLDRVPPAPAAEPKTSPSAPSVRVNGQ